ncbi:MAG: molecular chaperone TorD family protein [Phycisphaerales bacterium]|nr:molecular chaperone TorD family protein [Phycisphaerales bacterium]
MNTNDANQTLLAQSDLLLLLADAFRMPPLAHERLGEVAREDVADLVRLAFPAHAAVLAGEFDALLVLGRELPVETATAEFHRLFEGGMPCPLNETAYIRRDKGALLGDVCGFYRAFGWQPAAGTAEKPDHLVCELEFVALLLVMRASAAQDGRNEAWEITCAALERFADAHLGDWAPAVGARLRNGTAVAYFQQLGAVLASVWEALTTVHHWKVVRTAMSLPILEPESPYECVVSSGGDYSAAD